jgi:hypothetical protein
VVANDRTMFVEGGQAEPQSVVHTRSTFGDQTCISSAVLKITDFEVVLDRWNAPDCS